jgi:hypothetical protein
MCHQLTRRTCAALLEVEETVLAAQIARNRAALAVLDAWSEAAADDDGSKTWEAMLQKLGTSLPQAHA